MALRFAAPFIVATLAFAAPPPALGAPAEQVSAQDLYYAGEAKYSAANYVGAIEDFTLALEMNAGERGSANVRAALLFNLARSHFRQYDEVSPDIKHLRTARSIYQRYLDESEADAESYDSVKEATAFLDTVDARLEAHEAQAAESQNDNSSGLTGAPPSGAPGAADSAQASKHKIIGVALIPTGVVLLGGGVAMIVWGSTFKKHITEQVFEGKPADYIPTGNEQLQIDEQAGFGATWMGVGGGLAVVGGGVMGVGVWQLLKGKKMSQVAAAPVIHRGFSGITISGRF